jgi:hypothetical protein
MDRQPRNASQGNVLNLLETVVSDTRLSVRSLLRSPLFTAAVILTLALGIGANTAICTLINAVVLCPLPVPDPQQLYALGNSSGMTTITADNAWERDEAGCCASCSPRAWSWPWPVVPWGCWLPTGPSASC